MSNVEENLKDDEYVTDCYPVTYDKNDKVQLKSSKRDSDWSYGLLPKEGDKAGTGQTIIFIVALFIVPLVIFGILFILVKLFVSNYTKTMVGGLRKRR